MSFPIAFTASLCLIKLHILFQLPIGPAVDEDCLWLTGAPLLGFSWPAGCHWETMSHAWRGWRTGMRRRTTSQERPLQPPVEQEVRRPATLTDLWKTADTPLGSAWKRALYEGEARGPSGTS